MATLVLPWHDAGPEVRLNHDQDADEDGEGDAVPEDGAQDRAGGRTFGMPAGGNASHDDALGVDHLAHDSARTVGGAHQDGRKAELFGRYLLQVAEENIRRSVAAGKRDSQPANERGEEGKPPAGAGHRQSHGRIRSAISSGESE